MPLSVRKRKEAAHVSGMLSAHVNILISADLYPAVDWRLVARKCFICVREAKYSQASPTGVTKSG